MESSGAIRTTLDRAAGFATAAKAALGAFAPGPFRQALMDVADYTVRRVT